jgi:hypothetical protein
MKNVGGLIVHTDWDTSFLREVEGGVEIRVACRARSANMASVFIPREHFDKIVVLRRSFNARVPARIEGEGVLWWYADGHGMELVAVIRRNSTFELWLPGHHSHGPGTRYRGYVDSEGNLKLELLPSAKRLEL